MMTFYLFFCIIVDIMIMNGLTITEIANSLGISREAAKTRIIRSGIQPKDHAGKTNIYDESIIEQIKNVPGKGRPKKDKTP
jgi:orotate phosphoribosyltransferase-like protein